MLRILHDTNVDFVRWWKWAVGLTATSLPPELFASGGSRATGLTADVVNRAAELVIAIPLGLACCAWLVRRARRAGVERVPLAAAGGV